MPLDISYILEIFCSSSSCLEVFLIHDERSKHLVKPWMKVIDAMQNNHSYYLHVYFISYQFEVSIYHHSLQLVHIYIYSKLIQTDILTYFRFLCLCRAAPPLKKVAGKKPLSDFFGGEERLYTGYRVLAFTWRHFNIFDAILRERTDNQRLRTQSNNPNLYIVWYHILEISIISVAGVKLLRIWRPEILDETQLIIWSPQKLRN